MGIEFSRTRLQQTLKELHMRWEKANVDWDDQVSREFRETYISQLDPKVKTTMNAMDKMSEQLKRLKRDCG